MNARHFIKRYCNDLDFKLVFSSFKIANVFCVKDPIPGGLHSSVVYKFTCAGCNAFYVGETCFTLWRQCCPVVRVLGLHAAAPGQIPF